MWELKYCQLCLLFQYNLVPEFVGHQYFWFQFHSKFYLSDLSVCACRRSLTPVLRSVSRCLLRSLSVCGCSSSSVFTVCSVCVLCVCVVGGGWSLFCSICRGCLISPGIWPWQGATYQRALAMTTLCGCFLSPDPRFLQACG